MTNPISWERTTVILKDLPNDLVEELGRQAEQRGIAASELAQELISRHIEAGGEF
jgi:hypothetical protein